MGRKLAITSAIAGAVLVFGVTTANAHETQFETGMALDEVVYNPGHTTVTGHLTSAKEGCLPGRTVKFFAMDDSGTPAGQIDDVSTLLDTDRTSLNGAFYLEGNSPEGTDYWIVRAGRRNIGPSGHKHICLGAASVFS